MTIGLIMTWFLVFGMMLRAVALKQILWPQKQEDRDEGGWGRDEVVRKGEVRSGLQSRQTSDTTLNVRGPQLVVTAACEGPSQGVRLDPQQVIRALVKPENVDSIDSTLLRDEHDGGLFMRSGKGEV